MTFEDTKTALAALETHLLTGSLDNFQFVELLKVLQSQPDDFWDAYFLHFNPPSEEANSLLRKLGQEATEFLESMVIGTKDHSSTKSNKESDEE